MTEMFQRKKKQRGMGTCSHAFLH